MTPVLLAAAIDTTIVGELVTLVTTIAGLFTVFPINVFLIGSLVGLGFGIFRKAKKSAK